MRASMSLEPAQREVGEDGSDDGNGVKKSCGQAPAVTPASLAPVHSVETQALP